MKSFKTFDEELFEKLSSGIKDQLKARNPEHPFLKAFSSDEDFNELKELWDSGEKDEAARMFRSKLVKIANSKLGTSLILMVSGAALTSAGYNALNPPKPDPPIPVPPKPDPEVGEMYTIKKGDSIWKIAKGHLPKGAGNNEIMAFTKQIAAENGMNVKLIDGVLTKVPGDPDLIFPGGKLVINKFTGL
jgi:hypothetical protein